METRYLLDTNVVSETIRKKPYEEILRRFYAALDVSAIAAATWHELIYGMLRLPEGRGRLELFQFYRNVVLLHLPILPFDQAAAEWLAGERARLVSIGRSPNLVDGMIASIAATNGLTLVTRNIADFADFKGLKLENWFE